MELSPEMLLWEQCLRASGPQAGLPMWWQIQIQMARQSPGHCGPPEQVAHQLLQATLDCHLGVGGVRYIRA